MSAESSFAEAVATFTHGNRYDNYLRVVRMGLNARNGDAEAVADYILAHSPPPAPNPAKIRDAIRYALAYDRETGGKRRTISHVVALSAEERRERRRLLLPASARQFVPVTLRGYGRTTAFTGRATADILGESIRMSDTDLHLDEAAYRRQAAAQLHALHPGGRVWAGTIVGKEEDRKRLGIRHAKTPILPSRGDDIFDPAVRAGIVNADTLADRIERGDLAPIPCHVSLNTLTGTKGLKANNKPSFDCLAAVATFRYVLIEFDLLKDANGTPSQAQIDAVAGLIDYARETGRFRVVCAVYTGGKSIHVVLRVPADNLDAYRLQCAALADLFASADDPTFRIDTSGWTTGANAATHVRLAGAIRPETGRRARLLWAAT